MIRIEPNMSIEVINDKDKSNAVTSDKQSNNEATSDKQSNNEDGVMALVLKQDGVYNGTVASQIIFYFICHFWYKFYLFLA